MFGLHLTFVFNAGSRTHVYAHTNRHENDHPYSHEDLDGDFHTKAYQNPKSIRHTAV